MALCRPAVDISMFALHKSPPSTPLRSRIAMVEELPLRELVKRDRQFRRTGVAAGAALVAVGWGVGVSQGLFEAWAPLPVIGVLAFNRLLAFYSCEEKGTPLDEADFKVDDSSLGGQGLFATRDIEGGTYLFSYEGEVLDEDTFFERYPDGDGRYIACVDDVYIDGADPEKSNMARWMNHRRPPPAGRANVEYLKQMIGPNKAMHFYAREPIKEGDELTFYYGEDYWKALGETPVG